MFYFQSWNILITVIIIIILVTTNRRSPARTPSPVRLPGRFPTSASSSAILKPNRRGRGIRKLPATPTQPSTLNLACHLSGTDNGQSNNFLGVDLFTFPRLETSPTRMKLLLQSLGNKKQAPPLQQQVQIECLNGKFESTILEFFRLLQQPPSVPARRCLPGRSGIARWSRSLDDHPVTFEEAVIAGRGSRQLPVVGPQQLLASSGRIYFLFFKSDSSNRKSFQMHKPPSFDEFFRLKSCTIFYIKIIGQITSFQVEAEVCCLLLKGSYLNREAWMCKAAAIRIVIL